MGDSKAVQVVIGRRITAGPNKEHGMIKLEDTKNHEERMLLAFGGAQIHKLRVELGQMLETPLIPLHGLGKPPANFTNPFTAQASLPSNIRLLSFRATPGARLKPNQHSE